MTFVVVQYDELTTNTIKKLMNFRKCAHTFMM